MWGTYDGTLAITAANNVRDSATGGLVLKGVNLTGYDSKGNPTTDGTPNTTKISAIDYYQNGSGNGYFGPTEAKRI
jgi:hypothetical protein